MSFQISRDYYPNGDMLSIILGAKGRKGVGYELSEYIYIRIDPSTNEPLGLTVLSYSKLLRLNDIQLSFWNDLTQEMQGIMMKVLNSEPVNRFLNLSGMKASIPVGTFQNPSLQEIVAA